MQEVEWKKAVKWLLLPHQTLGRNSIWLLLLECVSFRLDGASMDGLRVGRRRHDHPFYWSPSQNFFLKSRQQSKFSGFPKLIIFDVSFSFLLFQGRSPFLYGAADALASPPPAHMGAYLDKSGKKSVWIGFLDLFCFSSQTVAKLSRTTYVYVRLVVQLPNKAAKPEKKHHLSSSSKLKRACNKPIC